MRLPVTEHPASQAILISIVYVLEIEQRCTEEARLILVRLVIALQKSGKVTKVDRIENIVGKLRSAFRHYTLPDDPVTDSVV